MAIGFYTEIGTEPEAIEFGEPLPVIPPTDGMVHAGWVNYFNAPVTSTAWDDLLYHPRFKAVWEEAPITVDYTITYQTEHGTAPTSKTVTVNAGESYTLTADDLPTLTAEGYTFKGWTANGTAVSVGDSISANTTLTAVWEVIVVLPEWTSGDGYALYDALKLPKAPTDTYMIIGYDDVLAKYVLIASTVKFTYGTKLIEGEGVYTGFIADKAGYAIIYHLNGNTWEKYSLVQPNAGGMTLAFTIEQTVWANYDIQNDADNSEILVTAGKFRDLAGYKVLEWDGNTDGLTQGSGDYSNYYRVSDAVLPDLDGFELSGTLVKKFRGVVTETWEGKPSCSAVSCEKLSTDGLWRIYDWFSHFLNYAEKAVDGLPEAGLYFYHDGTDRTVLFAYKFKPDIDLYYNNGEAWVYKGLYETADDTWKNKQAEEVYERVGNEWVKIAPSE